MFYSMFLQLLFLLIKGTREADSWKSPKQGDNLEKLTSGLNFILPEKIILEVAGQQLPARHLIQKERSVQ